MHPSSIRLKGRAFLGLGLVTSAALVAGVAPSAMAVEFTPKPTASITTTCSPAGYVFHLGNVDGTAPADFWTESVDESDQLGTPDIHTYSEPSHGSEDVVTPAVEDHVYLLRAYATGTVEPLAELTTTIDCIGAPTATIVPECAAAGPVLQFTLHAFDPAGTDFQSIVDGVPFQQTHLGVNSASYPSATQPEGQPVTASVTVNGTAIATYSATPHCRQPDATITLVCTAGVPSLGYHLANKGQSDDQFAAVDNQVLVQQLWIKAGGAAQDITEVLAPGATFDASVIDQSASVTAAHLAGVAHCDQPTTTVPAPTTTTTAAPAPAPLDPPPAAAAVPVVVTPAFTG